MAPLCKQTNPSTSQGSEVRGTHMGLDKRLGTQWQVSVNRGLVIWWQAYRMMRAEEG